MPKRSPRRTQRMETLEARQLLSGTVTAALVPVTISNAAKAADPSLANYSSYDVKVTQTETNDFASCDLKVTLLTGSFYIPSQGNSNSIQSGFWGTLPNLEFDTYVSSSTGQAPIILGSYSPSSNTPVFSATEVNVTFGDLATVGAGTFTVARLTMLTGSIANITGQVGNVETPTVPSPFAANLPAGGLITGNIYNDLDADGVKDSNESNMQNVQAFVDANNNGQLDTGEKSVKTNSKGNYFFTGMANASYRIRCRVFDGYRRTQPSTGSYNVGIVSSSTFGSGKNFGQTQKALISGKVFKDNDNDGKLDSGEPGLAGWTVFSDADGDGVLDANEARAVSDSSGNYNLIVSAGTHTVKIVQQSGWKRTTQGSFVLSMASGGISTNKLFGEKKL